MDEMMYEGTAVPNGASALEQRVAGWKSKLLDLSKRNRMLNYRETKRSTLKILEPGFEELFNRLALNEEELTFQRPVDRDSDLRTFSILALLETLSYPLPVHIGDIKTEGSVIDRQQTLRNLRSKSKLARDEQGANILYLSFGFIEWREKNAFDAPSYRAPVLMMPVSLNLAAINAPFTLSRYDDEIEVNPTLDYFLNDQFGINLPAFELKDADSIREYMDEIEEIADRQGWRLIREVSMGLLSFLKISMYHDLESNRERMLENPVIRAITGDRTAVNEVPEAYRDFDFDKITPTNCYQVVNSDSSQMEAILLSKLGISFVMQGPPGTGKSQTITNIIAEALADGKKVLFVSEKAAALQVVLKRLEEVNLADFCLALHSHKANKKEILDSIGSNLNLKHARVKESVLAELTELFHNREYLNAYAQQLHAEIEPMGESLYTMFGRLSQLEDATVIVFAVKDPLEISAQQLAGMIYCVGNYEKALRNLEGPVSRNPWNGSAPSGAGRAFQMEFVRMMEKFPAEMQLLLEKMGDFVERSGCSAELTWRGAEKLRDLLKCVAEAPVFPTEWADVQRRRTLIEMASSAREILRDYGRNLAAVSENFDGGVFALDLEAWLSDVRGGLQMFRQRGILRDDQNLEDVSGLHEKAQDLLRELDMLIAAFEGSRCALEIPAEASFSSAEALSGVCGMILAGAAMRPEWLDAAAHADACRMHGMVRSHLDAYRAKTAGVLEKWEPSALEIDAEAMLMRFKTQYTGIFKGLKAGYRADMRTIRGLHKSVGAQIEDETAIGLLQELQEIRREKKWFDENELALQVVFGELYRGVESDWEGIAKGLSLAESVRRLYPGGIVPESVADLLCRRSAHSGEYVHIQGLAAAGEGGHIAALRSGIENLCPAMSGQSGGSLAGVIRPMLAEIQYESERLLERIVELRGYFVRSVPETEYIDLVDAACRVQNARRNIMARGASYRIAFGERYRELGTDWDAIIEDLMRVEAFCAQAEGEAEFIRKIACDPCMRGEAAAAETLIGGKLAENAAALGWFSRLFNGKDFADLHLAALGDRVARCLNGFSELDRWMDYTETKAECERMDLSDFVQKIEALDNSVPDVLNAFKRGFYEQWCSAAAADQPAVRAFRRRVHEERIGRFCELDERQLSIAQARIREKVISRFPDTDRLLTANDEVRILQHELGKKRRIMPLRRLFKEIPNLLMTLKPCLMMSPLSVAYFLEAGAYQFDMVIFDEASQIFPQDAIGAIFRGRQVIIAGDSRQLPPTNFFAASTSNSGEDYDDEDEYDENVYDSILEETASLLPNRTLRWHYRSRHEHLIAFSNQEIYKNELVTFPSSRESQPDTGVEFVYVEDGVYEGGGRNCNLAEARRCVELVREHIERHPDRTLGIIAFSEKQQQAISQQIQRFREQNPKYEKFFAEDREGEFFVKNLENVQGDERDTIIFSICYARTARQKAQGKPMAMRFGPLGHQGGERRLNVAITRARQNIKLVSSILPSDIDLERTQSEGIRLLRAYIDFARKGSAALRSGKQELQGEELVESVASCLEKAGYTVRRHVGCSDYRIDIAVEHPTTPDCFVAGVECDGYSYAAAKTARDRDHLRRSVLESMGWSMYRIWSAEWRSNPLVESRKLLDFVAACVRRQECRYALPVEEEENADSPDEMFEQTSAEGAEEKSAGENPYGFETYITADWLQAPEVDASQSADERYVSYVIGVEQPIAPETLYQRMAGAYGRQKVTSLVRRNVDLVLAELKDKGKIVETDGFLQLSDFGSPRVRIAPAGEEPRPIAEIAPAELMLALMTVAEKTFGLTQDGLIDETARALGYARRGDRIGTALTEALERLLKAEKLRLVEGKISLVSHQREL